MTGRSWAAAAAVVASGLMAGLAVPGAAQTVQAQGDRARVYANPIDLPYRFQAPYPPFSEPRIPFREAADPMVVAFKGEYWLFVSHSLGYWRSTDLQHWRFVRASGYAVEKFAPTVVAIDGRLYLATSEDVPRIWTTDDPGSGRWTVAAELPGGFQDPCLFLDDDGRLYVYDGLSPTAPLNAAELDRKTFRTLRRVTLPASRDKATRGWEVPGNANELVDNPSYIEGAAMTKHDGRYYLEYSGPGTEFKGYANGLLTATAPMGPFAYAPYSPFAAKPSGFITGAGHGGTFQGPGGAWWHVGTMTISRRHIFERRLGLFPTRFTAGGEMVADTYLGDYPHYYDGARGLTGWMLLSRGKPATASSSLPGFGPERAADEDVRSWWSAASGSAGEWYRLDLGAGRTVEAVQVNFADQDADTVGMSRGGYRFAVEASDDGKAWRAIVPESRTGADTPHAWFVLPRATAARFVRVRNLASPNGAKFSLYDLRVFGHGAVPLPGRVTEASAVRDAADPRRASFRWVKVAGADFYIVRYGIRPDLMIQSQQVYGDTQVAVRSLNAGVPYVFTVDAVNERGITPGGPAQPVR
ncbi:endo-1,4-beta-xylanase [Sphingomonas metalli]|uniref:Endo-1,4-beta-xylanase n=1 Tax=Sphingomonas metalli TaxID=1779358 RepID=A0A916TDB9_9SPHN|nr:family 43 glycosylhydrolase [Sphingomonas metalli]GGB38291.1 endo-1,4-beta-xylanase [Sphingomonas metalli]